MKNLLALTQKIMHEYYVSQEIIDTDKLKTVLNDNIDNSEFDQLLSEGLNLEDGELMGDIIYIGFLTQKFNINHKEYFSKLLLLKWHKCHEDIASLFQDLFNNDKTNIPVIIKAIHHVPSYLQEVDFKYPYIRKLIYAIGAQPEPFNLNALEGLTKSQDEKIRNIAAHQIEKRNQYGRWEAKHNRS